MLLPKASCKLIEKLSLVRHIKLFIRGGVLEANYLAAFEVLGLEGQVLGLGLEA